MVVIDGAAGYVPLYRIDRADIAEQHGGRPGGETAVPGRDENHITMASEAAEAALERSGVDPEEVGGLFAASVSDYYAEHGIAAQVAYRLGATGDLRTGDFQATGRAAADALSTAESVVNATHDPVLVTAADVMPVEAGHDDESSMGAGAGAVVLRPDADSPTARLDAVGQATTGFVERHREHGAAAENGDGRFERRHGVRPAVTAALDRVERAGEADTVIASAPGYRLAQTALESLDAEHISTFNDVGYAGAATLLLDLAHALESVDDSDRVVAVAYGQGGADVFELEAESGAGEGTGMTVGEQLEAKEYIPYARHLEYRENYDYQGVPST